MSIEAMKQALEALESCTPEDTSTGHVVWPSYDEQAVEQAITSLRQAITTEESSATQEPVIKEVVVNADYREMWAEQVRLNQQLCAQISQPKASTQEPVLWQWKDSEMVTPFEKTNVEGWRPLYTHPKECKCNKNS